MPLSARRPFLICVVCALHALLAIKMCVFLCTAKRESEKQQQRKRDFVAYEKRLRRKCSEGGKASGALIIILKQHRNHFHFRDRGHGCHKSKSVCVRVSKMVTWKKSEWKICKKKKKERKRRKIFNINKHAQRCAAPACSESPFWRTGVFSSLSVWFIAMHIIMWLGALTVPYTHISAFIVCCVWTENLHQPRTPDDSILYVFFISNKIEWWSSLCQGKRAFSSLFSVGNDIEGIVCCQKTCFGGATERTHQSMKVHWHTWSTAEERNRKLSMCMSRFTHASFASLFTSRL